MATVVDVHDASAATDPRQGRTDRQRTVVAAFFLVFLMPMIVAALQEDPLRRWAGLLVTAAFAVWYVTGLLAGEDPQPARLRGLRLEWWFAGLTALTLLQVAILGSAGLYFLFYVASGAGGALPGRRGVTIVLASGAAYALGALALSVTWPWALGVGCWVVLIGLSVWSGERSTRARRALADEREQKAALAVDLERARMARDLHDILGHSLTVVTVKAQLAARLVEADPERAKAEIADVERLARDALADVRATVRSYRSLSLPAELVGARRAFEAAEITADVPGAAEQVRTDLRDLFAWAIREGVTNVVRHSGARHAVIVLTEHSVEIRDDGRGIDPTGPVGNGLTGLAERARLVGARVDVGSGEGGRGTVLRVEAAGEEA